jgi:phosphoribosylformylglycinamidine synthase
MKNEKNGRATQVLILRTAGTNCDMETKFAFESVGAEVDLVHVNRIMAEKTLLRDYDILVFPGGFTYGDDISAGKILANELKSGLREEIDRFVDDEKLVLGICNGFQILAKLGLLPGGKIGDQAVTLTNNTSGVFQCEWIRLTVEESPCVFTRGMGEIELPIAHAEGRFVAEESVVQDLLQKKQIPISYKGYNPNGSMSAVAGVCDPSGRIFGLMPHPERFMFKTQHPRWTRESIEPYGLSIFKNAVDYVITRF